MIALNSRVTKLERQTKGNDIGLAQILISMNIEKAQGAEASNAYLDQFNPNSPLIQAFEAMSNDNP